MKPDDTQILLEGPGSEMVDPNMQICPNYGIQRYAWYKSLCSLFRGEYTAFRGRLVDRTEIWVH